MHNNVFHLGICSKSHGDAEMLAFSVGEAALHHLEEPCSQVCLLLTSTTPSFK